MATTQPSSHHYCVLEFEIQCIPEFDIYDLYKFMDRHLYFRQSYY